MRPPILEFMNGHTNPNAATITADGGRYPARPAGLNYFESEPAPDSTRIVAVAWAVA